MTGVKRTPETIANEIWIDACNGVIFNKELYQQEMQKMLDESTESMEKELYEGLKELTYGSYHRKMYVDSPEILKAEQLISKYEQQNK